MTTPPFQRLAAACLIATAAFLPSACSNASAKEAAAPERALLEVELIGTLPSNAITSTYLLVGDLQLEASAPNRSKLLLPGFGEAAGRRELVLNEAGATVGVELTRAGLPPGRYDTLWVQVFEAGLELDDGTAHSTALGNLQLELGAIEIPITPPLEVATGQSNRLTVDLGLWRSAEPSGAGQIRLEPAPRAVATDRSGGLAGVTVRSTDLIAGVDVRVLPAGETEHDWITTQTDTEGRFDLAGLPEGSYDVRVAAGHLKGAALGVRVRGGRTSPLTIQLEDWR